MAIALSEINFRRAFRQAGHQDSELKFKTPWYPVIPWAAFIMSLLSCVLIIFDPNQRVALLYMVPFIAVCYGVYYRKKLFKHH
jgi:S-methylmethionine transporter